MLHHNHKTTSIVLDASENFYYHYETFGRTATSMKLSLSKIITTALWSLMIICSSAEANIGQDLSASSADDSIEIGTTNTESEDDYASYMYDIANMVCDVTLT